MSASEEDDWDDDGIDDDADEDEGEPTIPCTYCRAEIHEDFPRCPACGQYISAEDAPSAGKPLWIAAVFYIVYRWTAG